MLLKEEEAGEKSCPFGLVFPSSIETQKCGASECMMWRWEFISASYPLPAKKGNRGYCGLAGRPEVA